MALGVLARKGERLEGDGPGEFLWRFFDRTPTETRFEIAMRGPDLPSAVPETIVFPADIPREPKWRWTHRLVVAPPLITLDLRWRADSPLRIMAFSRGDWEEQLKSLAAAIPKPRQGDSDAQAESQDAISEAGSGSGNKRRRARNNSPLRPKS
jgi:hypothetical protein